ncbi:MAG: site-specific integrase [Ruminococcus sp.]|nr:site-specific integrase [Ruminococcus sp.]
MGQGSIYRRKDGRWEARLSLGTDKNGKRQSRSFYGTTREEANEKMHDFLLLLRTEVLTEITVRELCTEWLGVMQNHLKISTLANYRMKIEKHIIPAFGTMLCHELSLQKMHSFINDKIESGLSGRYVSDIIVLVKSILKYAKRSYGIESPLEGIIMPKCRKPEVKILSSDEQNTLKSYIAENITLTTLGIAISLFMGLRLGEVCALMWQDIDLEKRIMTVRRTAQRVPVTKGKGKTELVIMPPKSESSMREIPIPDFVFRMMSQLHTADNDFVISGSNKPLEPRTMQYRFAKILRNVNLPSTCTYHGLRHIFATSALEKGFDIKTLSEILGHSKIEVTLSRYIHSTIDRKRSCMELMSWSA